jgi:hypothetical protein
MSAFGTSRAPATVARPRPRTVEQLLDHEEALAIQRISDSLQDLGGDLCRSTDLRGRIRRHPLLAAGLGACLGFLGGPFVLRTFKRALSATSSLHIPGARATYALPGLVLASLRGVGGRR